MIIRENIPLSELTTMRLGGPARFVIDIESRDDIIPAFDFARNHSLPYYILGGGANTIARDAGFDGVIVRNCMRGITESSEASNTVDSLSGRVTSAEGDPRELQRVGEDSTRQDPPYMLNALGGTDWDAVVAYACERNLTGIEALAKIPGLAGAAPVQNIGAYGQDISDTFKSAEVYDIATGDFKTLNASDFHFSYRHSILNTTDRGRYFVISITLALAHGTMPRPFYNSIERYLESHPTDDFSPASIRDIVSTIRQDKLPDPADKASAGSFFKNIYLSKSDAAAAEAKGYPVYHGHDGLKINSAWLIEQCGLKGKLLHGIRVSSTAPLVLINESATGYADLAAARAEIIAAVQDKFGYQLEQEPNEL
ncbi:FAD-binding protein [Candidatus Saccharibacteria bacterium]|nr:FAD-binding protein [Candidatus Saccharibacteria bacterium]